MTIGSPVADATKAVLCFDYGPPDQLRVASVAMPPLDPANVRVRVRAAGVNFPDTLIILGKYQLRPEFPFAPGFEVSGEIVEVGDAAGDWSVGTKVVGLTASGFGGFADYADIRGENTIQVPGDVDEIMAAAVYTTY
ncbi:MAG: alcohol dehydrogenase catalytic domain-containing protein, partial [Novosphingobium sp.]